MTAAERFWLLLPRQLRALPADLAAVLGCLLVTNIVVFLPVINETPLRIVFGLPLVLFVPGYAFIAALFPETPSETETDPSDGDDAEHDLGEGTAERDGIDGIERVALSFGLSIAIVPLIGLALNFTPWGIRLVPILVSLSGFIVVTTAVAARRRWQLSPHERFSVPYRKWVSAGRSELFEPDSQADLALNVLLVLSVLLAAGSVAYAVTVPQQGETFTEFYLLTENESGDLVADGYPTEFTAGENESLVLGIGNQEHERTAYTVVAQLQRVRTVNNSTKVLESNRLRTFETTLGHNETWHRQHTITPTMTGERLRLIYLLYHDSAPQSPTVENAYREVHLWINVTEPQ